MESAKTRPSVPPEPGSVLLGVVAMGQVAYCNPSPPVTPELLVTLSQHGVPVENRIRFASTCIEHRCVQWKEEAGAGRCGFTDQCH